MTGPRLPAIGDHVWRAAIDGSGPDARPRFDGYVFWMDATEAVCVPVGTPEQVRPAVGVSPNRLISEMERHLPETRDVIRVATLFLVRRLHGWRWVPHDFRPQVAVGDRITRSAPFAPFDGLVVDVNQTAHGREWDVEHAGGLARFDRYSGEIARAIAGLDGWSWIPAGWPGEPAAGEEPR